MTNHTIDDWRKLAGLRQGIINRLGKKVARLEAELASARANCEAHTARLDLYDKREMAA